MCDWSCEGECVVGFRTAVWGPLCTIVFFKWKYTVPRGFLCVFLFVCFFYKVIVASTFLKTTNLGFFLSKIYWAWYIADSKRAKLKPWTCQITLHSVTCHRWLVLRVLANVRIFGVYRTSMLSSLDQNVNTVLWRAWLTVLYLTHCYGSQLTFHSQSTIMTLI